VKAWKGRRKDLPDQCQTASYATVVRAYSVNAAFTQHVLRAHKKKQRTHDVAKSHFVLL